MFLVWYNKVNKGQEGKKMINISEKTVIEGFSGKRGTLAQTLSDKNLHRNLHYDFFGARVVKGTVECLIKGEWRTVRFDALNGWARTLEVQ